MQPQAALRVAILREGAEGEPALRNVPAPRRVAADVEHDEAVVIRDLLGIQKRREVSEAERERLRGLAFKPNPRCEARSSYRRFLVTA